MRRSIGMGMLAVALAATASAQSPATGQAPAAAPRFAHIFGDHAVLQRDRPIAVWGNAAPGTRVTVRLASSRASATTGRDGRWRATLPAQPAGGPYVLQVGTGDAVAQRLADVMVGDVFLCGGQSNMEFPMRLSTNAWGLPQTAVDPGLRYVDIPNVSKPSPAADLDAPATWRPIGPDTIGDASAVCYYMARSLRQSEKVPVGFIMSEWGGTRIESWISAPSLRTVPALRDGVARVAGYARDKAAAIAQEGIRRDAWWTAHDPAGAAQADYRGADVDDRDWPAVPVGAWKESGRPDLAAFDGALWLRTTVDLTDAQAAAARTLRLGPIDRFDDTWVNGRFVGGGSIAWAWRGYDLPAGTLRAGRNTIALRVLGGEAGGGLTGAGARGVELADGTLVPLAGPWRYRKGAAMTGQSIAPAPWDVPNSLTTLHNGMIAPIAGYGLKLAAWYQGESNAGEASTYRPLLSMLMADWRRTFDSPRLPFFVVQLTAFGKPVSVPGPSDWASLREAQAQAVARDAQAGLAVTIDVGDRFDIHPPQKTVVGDRLARLARVIAYGHAGPRSGPEATAVVREGQDLVVRFRNVTGGLRSYGDARAIGFETCTADDRCRYATATARGDAVVLTGAAGADVTQVRYAWADAPFVNLFDGADLPAAPFRLPAK